MKHRKIVSIHQGSCGLTPSRFVKPCPAHIVHQANQDGAMTNNMVVEVQSENLISLISILTKLDLNKGFYFLAQFMKLSLGI